MNMGSIRGIQGMFYPIVVQWLTSRGDIVAFVIKYIICYSIQNNAEEEQIPIQQDNFL